MAFAAAHLQCTTRIIILNSDWCLAHGKIYSQEEKKGGEGEVDDKGADVESPRWL